MNLQSSHFPYTIGSDAPHPFQPAEMDFSASFGQYPKEKVDVVRNAYYNAIHYCDAQDRPAGRRSLPKNESIG